MSRSNLTVLFSAIVIALIGCAPAPTPTSTPAAARPTAVPATAAPTATAVPKVKVRSAYSQLNPDAAPVWVAKDLGFFEKNGLDIELVFIDGGTRHAQALIAKEVSIGFSSAAPVVNAAAGGADLVLIAGVVNRINYDFIALPTIKSGADLKGKKVAVSGPSGSSATALRVALRELFQLDPDKDVVTLSIGNELEREVALTTKQIDATVVNPDISIKAKKDGLVVLGNLWNRDIAYQHSAVVSTKAYLKANPEIATQYLKSIIQAIGYYKDPANKANVIKIMSKYLQIDDQEVLESAYARMSQTIFQCAPYVTLEGTKTVISETKVAVEKGLTPEQIVDNSFIKALEDSGFVKANCK